MREVATEIVRWLERGDRVALATLVHVQRSAPRLPGAHWATSEQGEMAGAISAGCVESDLVGWSRSIFEQGGAKLVSYDVADAEAMRIGLTCGGAIDVLLERFDGPAWKPLLEAVAADRPAVTAVAVAPERWLGRRMFLVEGDEVASGGVDPSIDDAVNDAMRSRMLVGGSGHCEISAGKETARVFVDSVVPRARLIVVGATQTAIPLCRLARELDFEVTVVDPRAVYATDERMADADRVVREWPADYFADAQLDANTYVVTLTHDEKFDVPTLAAALPSPARYVGALGSRRTHAQRSEKLTALGIDEAALQRVHAPVGLDLGGRAPAEIALSIMAQIVAVKYGKDD